jgi:putative ABC transport system permease protein
MLLHKKVRFGFTVFGLAVLFLLSSAQVGLLVGWCNTITAVTSHAGVDVWVMADKTVAWDYAAYIPRQRIYQVRNVKGVAWSEGMYVGWSMWQRPDGRLVSVQMVGLDRGSVGGPWAMREGSVEAVQQPNSVIVDELFLATLGVKGVGDEVEMYGERATIRGVSREVRTFTATPFVFTSLKMATRYDKAFRAEDVTFVIVRCGPGANPKQLAQRIAAEVPGVEALTTDELMLRSIIYWLVETGTGLILLTTASLGLVVGAVVASQTLHAITQDHQANYATLLAVGFSHRQLLGCVLLQGMILSSLGILLGSVALKGLSILSANTPAAVEMTALVYTGLVAVSLASSLLGSFLSVKTIFHLDPVAVFRI